MEKQQHSASPSVKVARARMLARTRGHGTGDRRNGGDAYSFGSWSHWPPFQDPPSAGIHFSWPRTSLNPSVPACWIAFTSRYILPPTSCGIPLRRAPFRGQSLPFAARAPVRGFGRQLIPVHEPVLTAHTKVFSSAVLLSVATFSAFAAMVLLLRRWPMQRLG